MVVVDWQEPSLWQVNPVSQRLSFAQDTPRLVGLCWQPLLLSQLSEVQMLLSSQLAPPPGMHWPAVQTSPTVHASPSLQGELSCAAGFEHTPVAGLHVPTAWHWSCATHVTLAQRLTPAHTPPVQTSLTVFPSPSSHCVLSCAAGFEHTPVAGLHVPVTWH